VVFGSRLIINVKFANINKNNLSTIRIYTP